MYRNSLYKRIRNAFEERVVQYKSYLHLNEVAKDLKNQIRLSESELKRLSWLLKNKEKEIKALIVLLEKAAGHKDIKINEVFERAVNNRPFSYVSDIIYEIRSNYFSYYRIMKDSKLEYYQSGKTSNRLSIYNERKNKFNKVKSDTEKILSTIVGYKINVEKDLSLANSIRSIDFEIENKISIIKNNVR